MDNAQESTSINLDDVQKPSPSDIKDFMLIPDNNQFSIEAVQKYFETIDAIIEKVMKEDVHYGVIFGKKKKMLLKPGAEVFMFFFRISNKSVIDNLSSSDECRYKVRSIATHIPTGLILGEGVGECTSNESNFKWRAALSDDEFKSFDTNRTRVSYKQDGYKNGKPNIVKVNQVRNDCGDKANNVLKIAKKRALVDMVLTVTATSSKFSQDTPAIEKSFEEEEEEDKMRTDIYTKLMAMCDSNRDGAIAKLKKITEFTGDKGLVPGVASTKALKGKRLKVIYSKVINEHQQYLSKLEAK